MTSLPIVPGPGICLSESYYSLQKSAAYVTSGGSGGYHQGQNRWDAGYNIEFQSGFPQKIAGWAQATATILADTPRSCCVWRDSDGLPRVGIGTESHLYYMLASNVVDITPLRSILTGNLTNPITTTINSNLVLIADTAAVLANGDWIYLSAAAAVGGLTLLGWFQVSAVNLGVGYTITAPIVATSSAGPAGGTTAFKYPRTNLTNPFTTTSGSATIKVTHAAHGAAIGNYVVFSGATAVGGLVLNGEFKITAIIDINNYNFVAAASATSSASGGGTVSTIYDIQVQQTTQTGTVGYGVGSYGIGAYGSTGAVSTPSLSNGWTLAAYGNQLLCCPIGGTIYVFDSKLGGRAYPLLNAPLQVNAMFVTPERFVVALGLTNQMELAWADQDDYTNWTTTPTNTAETGRTLVGGSFLVGGIGVRQGVSLIWTDRCVFAMSYIGSQEIYSTQQYGDNCGLVDPTAVCVSGGIAYWMSDQDFWAWNGSATVLPSDDIRNYVFSDGKVNRQSMTKCTATLNRAKRQVRFYYPDGANTENNLGVIYHYDQQCWSLLNYGRSAASDSNLLSEPVSTDVNGIVYFDETGTDANGVPLPYLIQMAPVDITNGDKNVDIFGFLPDYQYVTGAPQLNILTQYYPLDTPTVDGPYSLSSTSTRQDLRSAGKMFAFSLSDNTLGSNFRLGVPRIDIQPAGARR